MAIIIIVVVVVAFISLCIHNELEGRRMMAADRAEKEFYDRMYALRRLEKEREERAYQARLDQERVERLAAEKAAKAERESRPYGTFVHTRDGRIMEYGEYRRLSKW